MKITSLEAILKSAYPVMPVIVIDELKSAIPLAQTLVNAGVKVLEITLRTECALMAIEQIKTALPELIVGAGTYTEINQLSAVIKAGGDFVVSPGIHPKLLDAAQQNEMPILPGVMTPSDILLAIEYGLNVVKLFPAASAGGVDYLKDLQGPFPKLKFCPTGGINSKNYSAYLALDNVICVGGSWLAPSSWIKQQRWKEIGQMAKLIVAE
ncbi:MAG: bifunctional 4-hydroxy-2-oxoglutarate aldolase/2-dehydro-3-deoxy-phosphogluconate aldolase [Pseudomonadales bacterium]|nr:bifunctional 4-hydroxy-2-oxoglutarate aldolase/2-dehydro-3-deoxy-phosphogluconate aldolase [Pseudomonadales bacterium]MCP5214795.1 bifunctional 4-hydroxy-2-oxoglutarate aldolase/2-dehydro-3-deoxy-phosphogluconate aldolase [Pseudomonadales bacterium]